MAHDTDSTPRGAHPGCAAIAVKFHRAKGEDDLMSKKAREIQPVTRRKKGADAIPELIWAPLVGGLLTLIPGLIGLAAGNPWLFPSLGPTAFLQAANPQQPSSRF